MIAAELDLARTADPAVLDAAGARLVAALRAAGRDGQPWLVGAFAEGAAWRVLLLIDGLPALAADWRALAAKAHDARLLDRAPSLATFAAQLAVSAGTAAA